MNLPSLKSPQANSRELRIEGVVVGFIIAAIIEAEIALALVPPLLGVILHSVVILTILNVYLLIPLLPHRKILLALLILPILRIVSLSVPIAQLPQLYWYAADGIPVMISVLILTRMIHPPASYFVVNLVKVWRQIAFGMLGIPLAYLAFRIAPQKPLVPTGNLVEILIGIVSLVVFSGFIEEYIFRYLIQFNLEDIFGEVGLWIGGALFTGLYLGAQTLPLTAFWGLVGMGFSYWVKYTESIWGVVIAHSLLLITALIFFPLVKI
jgi:uncharacterized protein